jgi:hypothetical protein
MCNFMFYMMLMGVGAGVMTLGSIVLMSLLNAYFTHRYCDNCRKLIKEDSK